MHIFTVRENALLDLADDLAKIEHRLMLLGMSSEQFQIEAVRSAIMLRLGNETDMPGPLPMNTVADSG